MISVEIDPTQVQEIRDRLDYLANGANRALSRALNKTASKAKTLSSRAIRDQVNLSATYVRERLKGPANGWEYKATVTKLQAKLSTPKRGILLREFVTNFGNARAGRPLTPIRLKVKTGGSSQPLVSGFYVRTKGSNVLTPAVRNEILRRLGMTRTLDNGAFTVLHGPSLSQVFTDVKDSIAADMSALLAENMTREMDWLLQKYPPPGDDGASEEAA